jgi:hypothetical protein
MHWNIETTAAAVLCATQNQSTTQHIFNILLEEVIRIKNSSREVLVNPKDMK